MPAVEVHNLRKEFRRSDGKRSGLRRRRESVEALRGISFEIARGECVAILGQNGSGKSTLVRLLSTLLLHDGGSATVFGHDVFKEHPRRAPAREPRLGRGLLLQEDVLDGEPLVRGALLRDDARRDARRDSAHPREGRLPLRSPRRGDGGPLPRHAAEGRARARAADRSRSCSCSTSRRRASTRARSSRSRTSSARSGRSTTRRSCSARTTSTRPRRSPTASASSTAATCSSLEPVEDLKRTLRRRDARGGVLRRDRQGVRGREATKRTRSE